MIIRTLHFWINIPVTTHVVLFFSIFGIWQHICRQVVSMISVNCIGFFSIVVLICVI